MCSHSYIPGDDDEGKARTMTTTTTTTNEEIIVQRLCKEFATTMTSSKNNVNGQENMTKRRTDRLHKVTENLKLLDLESRSQLFANNVGYCGDGPTGTTLSDAMRHSN